MDRLTRLNLLFLEDNDEFAANTSEFLKLYFKSVLSCKSIKEAQNIYNDNRIDVILSDIMIEGKESIEFIRNVRSKDKKCLIACLSAYSETDTLLRAIPLNLCAYALKPIRHDDFVSLLRKIANSIEPREKAYLSQELVYDYDTKELSFKSNGIKLTKKEALFLELLIEHYPKHVTSERIQRDIWENTLMSDAAVKNMVLRLRKKADTDFISNVHAVGYKLSNKPSF